MNIVITGPKGAGKSSVGAKLAELTEWKAIETDRLLEALYEDRTGAKKSCREIFTEIGNEEFRKLEKVAVEKAAAEDWHVIITGGSTFLDPDSRRLLRGDSLTLFLTTDTETLWERATADGLPPWLTGDDGKEKFTSAVAFRNEVVRAFADVVLDTGKGSPEELAEKLKEDIATELSIRCKEGNTFGSVIRMTTFGESHGPAIGTVLDGVQPGIEISAEEIQKQLDRRRPGQSKVVTQRKEEDKIHILSGIFEGKTTGASIGMVIYNKDADSSKYDDLKDLFRPGHADFSLYKKYGLRDHRGGGRSSGRETACRVAAGAVARQILEQRGVKIVAHATEVGGIEAKTCDYDSIENNPIRCADPEAAKKMEEAIMNIRREFDSLGGIVQLEIHNVPPGLGDPIYAKLDQRIASAILSLGAIKGIEIGDGFALTKLKGSQSNDAMKDGGFVSNRTGGILGGISNGEPIVIRVAVKPTASIAQTQETIDINGNNTEVQVKGRHDPCIVPRVVPVVEALGALVVLDAWEIQTRIRPNWLGKK